MPTTAHSGAMRMLALTTAALAGLLAAALPANAAAALKVTAAGPAPVVAPAGAPIAVTASARGGSGRLGLVLAAGAKSAAGGVVLGGSGARVKRPSRVTVRGTVPASVPAGQTRFLLVCADAKAAVAGKPVSCRSAGRLPTSGPSLEERIDAAVAARRLTRGRAALYGFYAINRDPRLPLELRAASAGTAGIEDLVRGAARDFSSLPRAVRRELIWYFVPPAGKGSRWRGVPGKRSKGKASASATADCSGYSSLETTPYGAGFEANWVGVPTADGNAIVWYQDSEPAAQASARFYARILPEIWKKLSTEFGKPRSDSGVPCFHGPDGRFDVYVNDAVTFLAGGGVGTRGSERNLAVTMPYPAVGRFCTDRPAWIAMKIGQPRWALAHEFMHAIQFNHRYSTCAEPIAWWDEGGATWAADFVYPTDDLEKQRFPQWVTEPLAHSAFANADYEAYPFWMMLQRTQGTAVLRSIFTQLRTKPSVPAVDAAIPGGLRRQWPRFALQAFNQTPVGTAGFAIPESFAVWDRWNATPALPPAVALGLDGAREKEIDLPTQNAAASAPLSTAAYHRVNVTDEKVRELRFKNELKSAGSAHVDAMLRLADGSWKLQDWTGRDVTLCRDKADEDVQELIIVTTSAGPTQSIPSFTHKLRGRDACQRPTFRIVGYSSSVRSDTDRGFGIRSDAWKGTPGAPVSLAPCSYGPEICGAPAYALETRVITTADGTVNGPGPGCPYTYPTYTLENPGRLRMEFDPAGDGPATVSEPPPLLSVGDVTNGTCGANSTGRWNTPATASAPREQVLSGQPFTFSLAASGTTPTEPFSASGSISFTWSKSVTVQRVNEDGSPFGT